MQPPIELTVRFRAIDGQEQALADALAAVVPPTRQEAGCLRFDASRAAGDPATFLLVERWASQEALDAHGGTPHMKAFIAQHPTLLARAPEVAFWQALVAEPVTR
jgi:quinol monooxygenase YgiN